MRHRQDDGRRRDHERDFDATPPDANLQVPIGRDAGPMSVPEDLICTHARPSPYN